MSVITTTAICGNPTTPCTGSGLCDMGCNASDLAVAVTLTATVTGTNSNDLTINVPNSVCIMGVNNAAMLRLLAHGGSNPNLFDPGPFPFI